MLITLNTIEAQLELNRIEKHTLLTHLKKNYRLQIYIRLGTSQKILKINGIQLINNVNHYNRQCTHISYHLLKNCHTFYWKQSIKLVNVNR